MGWLVAVAVAASTLMASGAANARPRATTRMVSVSSTGQQGNSHSVLPSVSATGRYVAFLSRANNLVRGDSNNAGDVFVHDGLAGITTRASVGAAGQQANASSFDPAMSPTGRYVAFASSASNLVTGDTNNDSDVFVRDVVARTTSRVSVGSGGEQADRASRLPAISPDGRYIAFDSEATNLVPGDTNHKSDVFVRDLAAGTTTRVSVGSGGQQADSASIDPAISADGRYVAFGSQATNLVPGDTRKYSDVFVRDLAVGTTTRVSVGSGGQQANQSSAGAAISSDGRYIAFESLASNLVTGDTNDTLDVFLHDRVAGITTRVSVGPGGQQANSFSFSPALSADGRYIAFGSLARNLVLTDTNHARDVFVHDRVTGITRMESLSSAGRQGDTGRCTTVAISADGRHVAFSSRASNLVPNDTGYKCDVFVRDRPGEVAAPSA